MRKLFISSSIAIAVGLGGCGGGEDIDDIRTELPVEAPKSRILFDPSAGILNIPNDLLMLPSADGFFDYTLNIPVADPTNFGDPQNALNVLDGWSTSHPFVINVVTPANTSIDSNTLSAGVRIFEATLGLNQSDPDCAAIPVPSAGCKIGDELVYGVDYALSLAAGDVISVVPLKPLKAASGHVLVMTTALKDTNGNSVEGSTSWDLVKLDPVTQPLGSPAQLDLQNLVNSHIVALSSVGLSRDELTYVSAFTTQSTLTVPNTIKQLMIAEFAARAGAGDPTAGEALPAIVVTDATGPQNVMETIGLVTAESVAAAVQFGISQLPPEAAPLIPLIEATDFSLLQTCDGLFGTVTGQLAAVWGPVNDFAISVATGILGQAGSFCAASRLEASISLPYYLAIPRAENPLAPVNEFWTAACDSGIVLATTPPEVLATATPGPNNATCSAVGLADLRVNGEKLDPARNITQFSPVPQPQGGNAGNETLDVQVTIPNPAIAAGLGFQIQKPEAGWPVVILAHGITSRKEDMLAITGILSLAGFATVAIDQPMHGSRGFDLTGNGIDDLNATTVSATHYMNLASLPTARDNLRQSVSDLLGLRLGLNAFIDTSSAQTADIDPQSVSVMGVSLGGITGGNFAAVANSSLGNPGIDALFTIETASLESPGGGTTQFLLESPAFGGLIKGLLLSQSSPDFVALLVQLYGTADVTEAQLVAAVDIFLDSISAEELAAVNAIFTEFAFAAQTVLDGSDPINYGETLGSNTATLMHTVVGDGGDNLPDQVIPVTTALPLSGQDPLAGVIGLEQIVSTVQSAEPVSGQVKFSSGGHGSSLSPFADPAVTAEMQLQIATFITTKGRVIQISNPSVIAN